MIIVGSGCSFTHAPKIRPTDMGWLWWLEDMGYEVHNQAQGSGGNQLSTRSLIYALSKYHKDKDVMVIRQLSGYNRQAFLVEKNEDYFFDGKKYNQVRNEEGNHVQQTGHYGCGKFTTGSWMETPHKTYWRKIHPIYNPTTPDDQDELQQIYYKYIGGELQNLYETFESILYLQSYCESKGIPHLQFFGWDIFGERGMNISKYFEYDDIKVLINEIDWDKVITYEYDKGWVQHGKHNNVMGKYGGIHEYAVSELPEEDWFCDKMYYPDRFGHPHSNAHKAFAKNILLKRIKELYL